MGGQVRWSSPASAATFRWSVEPYERHDLSLVEPRERRDLSLVEPYERHDLSLVEPRERQRAGVETPEPMRLSDAYAAALGPTSSPPHWPIGHFLTTR